MEGEQCEKSRIDNSADFLSILQTKTYFCPLYAGSHMAFSYLFFSSLITFLFLDLNKSDRKGQLGPVKIHKSHLCISNFHIHVSVSDLHIPRIGPHILLQQNRHTDPGNIYCTSHGNWLWPHNFFSGNVCFEFSVLCLYARYLNVYI